MGGVRFTWGHFARLAPGSSRSLHHAAPTILVSALLAVARSRGARAGEWVGSVKGCQPAHSTSGKNDSRLEPKRLICVLSKGSTLPELAQWKTWNCNGSKQSNEKRFNVFIACPRKSRCAGGKERRIKRREHETVIDAKQQLNGRSLDGAGRGGCNPRPRAEWFSKLECAAICLASAVAPTLLYAGDPHG